MITATDENVKYTLQNYIVPRLLSSNWLFFFHSQIQWNYLLIMSDCYCTLYSSILITVVNSIQLSGAWWLVDPSTALNSASSLIYRVWYPQRCVAVRVLCVLILYTVTCLCPSMLQYCTSWLMLVGWLALLGFKLIIIDCVLEFVAEKCTEAGILFSMYAKQCVCGIIMAMLCFFY